MIDAHEIIVYANDSAAKNLGSANGEIVGQNYNRALFNRKNCDSAFCPISFALQEGETSHVGAETFFRRDRSELTVEYVCVPLFENEKIIGAVVTFEDIGERRDIETAIAEARDAALENAAARTAFLANMSHEIRTPLNGIIGTTELLLTSALDRDQRKHAEMLRTSADLLLEIVSEILDFSKIEAGKLTLETVPFDVRKLAGESLDLFSAAAHGKNLTLTAEIDEQVPATLFGDPSQLRQVLNNLLSNAVKFTETGEISARVSVRNGNSERAVLLFEISDTGIGIEPDAQKYLFEPFAQADVSTTRRFGGTGLGLAICRRIVEMMNGEIGLESRAGFGSRFWFTAELAVSSDAGFRIPDSRCRIPNSEAQKPKTKNQNPKVLIVDDNSISREIAGAMLGQIGVEAEAATSGLTAVEMCREKHFDLILMDCRMPEMDGFEAARQIIEQSAPRKAPKIIALTASATSDEREKCRAAGMSGFLTKPIKRSDLQSLLETVVPDQNPLQTIDLAEKLVHHSLSDLITREVLENLAEIESRGENNFVCEMLELFCAHTEDGIAEIEKAFSEKTAETIKREAHSLRGSSANIGARRLSELFERLEQEADGEKWEKMRKTIYEIAETFKDIKFYVEKKL